MELSQDELENQLASLKATLSSIPCVEGSISGGMSDEGWWVKFALNIHHPLAWRSVQELGFILNYLSLEHRLPTVFMPVSPPPYMNGGPEDFLSWVIECHDPNFSPTMCATWLKERLPKPIDEIGSWNVDDQ